MVNYIQIILESNSNQILDTFAKEIILAIKSSGAIKSGAIPLKGKRLIYCYNPNIKTFDKLLLIKSSKRINVTINSLEKS